MKSSTPRRVTKQTTSHPKTDSSTKRSMSLRDLFGDLLLVQESKNTLKDFQKDKLTYEIEKMHKYFQDQIEYFKANKKDN